MKSFTIFNFDMLFGDHMAKVSNQAKLYYIKLNFYADNGFVANPLSILDSLGFDKSVLQELINNDEVLTLEGRSEIFITAYYVHNKGLKASAWLKSPFAQYWKGKLWTKKNGVATFTPQKETDDPLAQIVNIETPQIRDEDEWDKIVDNDKADDPYNDDDLPF